MSGSQFANLIWSPPLNDMVTLTLGVGSPFSALYSRFTSDMNICYKSQECCICLSAYEDGSELRELPCGHHFHCMCLDKWLCINATCPLCKFNILKADSQSSSEEA